MNCPRYKTCFDRPGKLQVSMSCNILHVSYLPLIDIARRIYISKHTVASKSKQSTRTTVSSSGSKGPHCIQVTLCAGMALLWKDARDLEPSSPSSSLKWCKDQMEAMFGFSFSWLEALNPAAWLLGPYLAFPGKWRRENRSAEYPWCRVLEAIPCIHSLSFDDLVCSLSDITHFLKRYIWMSCHTSLTTDEN